MADFLTMYDPQTGVPVQVAASDAGALFREGKATFAADQDVPVLGADGRVQVLKGAQAGAYFTSAAGLAGGASSGTALREQQLQDEFGGVGGQAKALAAGVARGASLGLSDAALTQTGLVDPRTLAGLQEANAVTSGVGEVGGMLGAVLASGGTRGAAQAVGGGLLRRGAVAGAEALTAPTRAVMALGRGVEAAGGALLGEGAAARVATSAVQGVVEGGLFGVGQAVSDASIKDVPLTAERLLAAAGHGALLGGALSGGMTAAGALLRGAGSKVGEVGASLLGRAEARTAELGGELVGSVAPKTEGTLTAMVDRYGREQALKASGGTTAMIERLQKMPEDIEQRVIKKLLDDAPEILGKKPGSLLNAGEKAAAAEKIVQQDGERIGTMLDDLSRTGVKADVEGLIAQQRTKAAAELSAAVSPDAQRETGKFSAWLDSVEAKVGKEAGGDIKSLWEARRELRKDIDWKKAADSGDRYNEWKKDLYRAMGDEIEGAGAKAGGELGPDFAARWSNANRDYRAALWLQEATARGASREGANRVLGLSEQFGIIGGLMGGGLAAIPYAMGGAVVQHLVKRYGSDVAANVARAVTRGEGVHAIDQAIERMAGERVARLVGVGKAAVGQLPDAAPGIGLAVEKAVAPRAEPDPVGAIPQRYQAAKKELLDAMPGREVRAQQLRADLDQVAPGLGAAVAARTIAAQDFLASKLPQMPERPSLQPQLERPREPSFDDQQKFLRYARAVNDPLSALDDARRGKLRPEAVEALQAVYPALYQGLRAQVHAAVAARPDRLSYQERVRLGLLLDLPTDPSMEPKAIAQMQAAQIKAPAPNPAPRQGGSPGPRPSPVPFRGPSLGTRSSQIGTAA